MDVNKQTKRRAATKYVLNKKESIEERYANKPTSVKVIKHFERTKRALDKNAELPEVGLDLNRSPSPSLKSGTTMSKKRSISHSSNTNIQQKLILNKKYLLKCTPKYSYTSVSKRKTKCPSDTCPTPDSRNNSLLNFDNRIDNITTFMSEKNTAAFTKEPSSDSTQKYEAQNNTLRTDVNDIKLKFEPLTGRVCVVRNQNFSLVPESYINNLKDEINGFRSSIEEMPERQPVQDIKTEIAKYKRSLRSDSDSGRLLSNEHEVLQPEEFFSKYANRMVPEKLDKNDGSIGQSLELVYKNDSIDFPKDKVADEKERSKNDEIYSDANKENHDTESISDRNNSKSSENGKKGLTTETKVSQVAAPRKRCVHCKQANKFFLDALGETLESVRKLAQNSTIRRTYEKCKEDEAQEQIRQEKKEEVLNDEVHEEDNVVVDNEPAKAKSSKTPLMSFDTFDKNNKNQQLESTGSEKEIINVECDENNEDVRTIYENSGIRSDRQNSVREPHFNINASDIDFREEVFSVREYSDYYTENFANRTFVRKSLRPEFSDGLKIFKTANVNSTDKLLEKLQMKLTTLADKQSIESSRKSDKNVRISSETQSPRKSIKETETKSPKSKNLSIQNMPTIEIRRGLVVQNMSPIDISPSKVVFADSVSVKNIAYEEVCHKTESPCRPNNENLIDYERPNIVLKDQETSSMKIVEAKPCTCSPEQKKETSAQTSDSLMPTVTVIKQAPSHSSVITSSVEDEKLMVYKSYQVLHTDSLVYDDLEAVSLSKLSEIDKDVYQTYINPEGLKISSTTRKNTEEAPQSKLLFTPRSFLAESENNEIFHKDNYEESSQITDIELPVSTIYRTSNTNIEDNVISNDIPDSVLKDVIDMKRSSSLSLEDDRRDTIGSLDYDESRKNTETAIIWDDRRSRIMSIISENNRRDTPETIVKNNYSDAPEKWEKIKPAKTFIDENENRQDIMPSSTTFLDQIELKSDHISFRNSGESNLFNTYGGNTKESSTLFCKETLSLSTQTTEEDSLAMIRLLANGSSRYLKTKLKKESSTSQRLTDNCFKLRCFKKSVKVLPDDIYMKTVSESKIKRNKSKDDALRAQIVQSDKREEVKTVEKEPLISGKESVNTQDNLVQVSSGSLSGDIGADKDTQTDFILENDNEEDYIDDYDSITNMKHQEGKRQSKVLKVEEIMKTPSVEEKSSFRSPTRSLVLTTSLGKSQTQTLMSTRSSTVVEPFHPDSTVFMHIRKASNAMALKMYRSRLQHLIDKAQKQLDEDTDDEDGEEYNKKDKDDSDSDSDKEKRKKEIVKKAITNTTSTTNTINNTDDEDEEQKQKSQTEMENKIKSPEENIGHSKDFDVLAVNVKYTNEERHINRLIPMKGKLTVLSERNVPSGDNAGCYDYLKSNYNEESEDEALEEKTDSSNNKKVISCDASTVTDSLSEGEINCKCTISSGEVHLCKNKNAYKSDSEQLPTRQMLCRELNFSNCEIQRRNVHNKNWVSYYVTKSPNLSHQDSSSSSKAS